MTLSEFVAIEEIKKLKAKYCRYFDTKRWDDLLELFTEDAVFDVRGATSVGQDPTAEESPSGAGNLVNDIRTTGYQHGRDRIATFISNTVANLSSSVHHCHTPEIELTSANAATGIWAVDDLNQFSSGPLKTMHGFGHYHDVYVRMGGIWRIKSLRLTRVRVDIEMND